VRYVAGLPAEGSARSRSVSRKRRGPMKVYARRPAAPPAPPEPSGAAKRGSAAKPAKRGARAKAAAGAASPKAATASRRGGKRQGAGAAGEDQAEEPR
ncbi:MAG TPA: hypothetical protein VFH47_04995, partial [Candidatus Thermoplasmatota archaeon]|nr:hypothetical protein [Candidatus Thermoplasmatota archaeon]